MKSSGPQIWDFSKNVDSNHNGKLCIDYLVKLHFFLHIRFCEKWFHDFFLHFFADLRVYWDIYFCKCGYMAYGLVQKTTYKKLSTWRRGLSCAKDCGNWFHILQFWYQQKKETINIVLPFFANIFFSRQCRRTSYN